LYNYNGKKGIATASYAKDTNQHSLGIGNETFFFKDTPLRKVLFEIPSDHSIQRYLQGEYEVKSSLIEFTPKSQKKIRGFTYQAIV